DYLDNPLSPNPTSSPSQNVDYTVTTTNEYGCTNESAVSIIVFSSVPEATSMSPLLSAKVSRFSCRQSPAMRGVGFRRPR
ncbi:MAG: hypothetical protein ACKO7B_17130, partial [Flavobacteriales bacterium]